MVSNVSLKILTLLIAAAGSLGLLASPSGAGEYVKDANTVDELLESVDYAPADADALRLYRAFLNRGPGAAGSRYWIERTRSGASLDDLAWGFANSEEFRATYGLLDDSEFLTVLYSNMLGRQPDGEGFDYWLDQMDGGLAQFAVVRWVVANNEFEARFPFAPRTPSNPGDVRDCNDFASDTEAQRWFDHFFPVHGDVANLDPNGNGRACDEILPVTVSGSGDSVVSVDKPSDYLVADVVHEGSSGHFSVWSYGADGDRIDLLANETGSYSGRVLIDVRDSENTELLEVAASGSWTVTYWPLEALDRRGGPEIAGNGDDVFLLPSTTDALAVGSFDTPASGHFAVWAWGGSYGRDLLVNEIGPYSGQAVVPRGTRMFEVTSPGAWTIGLN